MTGVGRAHNAIQSIILQEMEKMESIFIITTNAGTHIDNAYSRRFIYQVFMPRPDQDVRLKIWQKHLPNFSNEALDSLSEYDLSGSEITNLIKKVTIYEIESSKPFEVSDIEIMIRDEKSHIARCPIGY